MTRSHQQKVWPLFVLAAALVLFGFSYLFAFPVEVSVETTSLPQPFLEPSLPEAESELSEPADLAYAAEDRTFRLDLRQIRQTAEHEVHARIAMKVTDSLDSSASMPPDAASWKRRYADATVQVADEAIIGRDISAEVERLIENSAHRVVADPSGEVMEYQLISSESAQLRQTLASVRQALSVLRPRFPREPVRAGEEWSWSAPVLALPKDREENPSRVEGNIDFRARVIGTRPQGVVIEVDFESSTEGLIRMEDEEHSFEAEGQGQARVVWSPRTRQIVESAATQSETIIHDDRTVEVQHLLRLVSE